jgi:hypothetical protein
MTAVSALTSELVSAFCNKPARLKVDFRDQLAEFVLTTLARVDFSARRMHMGLNARLVLDELSLLDEMFVEPHKFVSPPREVRRFKLRNRRVAFEVRRRRVRAG